MTQRDLRALLKFLRKIYGLSSLNRFAATVLTAFPLLVPVDVAAFCDMSLDREMSTIRTNPSALMTPTREVGRKQHTKPHPLPRVTGIELHRDKASFTERDKLLMKLARPHLVQARCNAGKVTRLRREVGALGSALEALHCALIALTPGGQVRAMTPRARTMLVEFFGNGSAPDHRLPEMLARWVRERRKQFAPGQVPQPLAPLVVERGEERLVARLLMDASQDLLLLQARRPPPDPASLESLGLTRREAEVLVWVARGKTNLEIATILGSSPRTVQKHLEHIFSKLGVESRTAAARIALQALPQC